jgi:hypothetical protein
LNTRLEKWNLVAGTLGSVGVVLSLFYVAHETQQNTKAVKGQTAQELVAIQSRLDEWLESEERAEAWLVANETPEAVSEAKRFQIHRWVRNKLNLFEHIYYAQENGLLADELGASWSRSYLSMICRWPISKAVFIENRPFYGVDFYDYVVGEAECF